MSGHSKWANIKNKKAATDQKKGKLFSRATRELIISVKSGGADPSTNIRLRQALIAARAVNMPNVNIDRAIKKASGEGADGNALVEIVYEGYAPGGVALLVECLTDNRNRTAGEVRLLFDRNNGNLASSGAVTWMFHRKTHFVVKGENATEDKLMEVVLDAGAEDIEAGDGVAEIWGPPDCFEEISKALEKAGYTLEEAGLAQKPENFTKVSDPNIARQVLRLVDQLEDHDDVQSVYHNADIPDEVLEAAMKELTK